jgi:hypothetical protein
MKPAYYHRVSVTHYLERYGDDELDCTADVVVQPPMGRSAPSDLDCYGYTDVDDVTVMRGKRDVTAELTDEEIELIKEACAEAAGELVRDREADYADYMLDRLKDERMERGR